MEITVFSFKCCVLVCEQTRGRCENYHVVTDRLLLIHKLLTVCTKQDQDRAQSIQLSDMHTVGVHHFCYIWHHISCGSLFSSITEIQ